MAQFAYPDSDIANNWSGTFADIDEGATPNDSDFVDSGDNPNGSGAEFGLSNLVDPQSSSGHIVRYRYTQTDGGVPESTGGTAVNLEVQLLDGALLVGSQTHNGVSGAWAAGSFTLSAAGADGITDYTNLRIKFIGTGGGGSPANRRGVAVSWAEVEVPDAPTATNIVRQMCVI